MKYWFCAQATRPVQTLWLRFLPLACRRIFVYSVLIGLLAALPVRANEPLTLPQAIQISLQQHPQLQAAQWRLQAATHQQNAAALKPAIRAGFEAENLAGSGAYSGLQQGEITLSLSSIIEPSAFRAARRQVADSDYQHMQSQQNAAALDLLAQVTRQFILTLAAQEQLSLLQEAATLAQKNEALISELGRRGATASVEVLRARAAREQAEIQIQDAAAALASERFALALLLGMEQKWGQNPAELSGSLFSLPQTDDLMRLQQQLEQSAWMQARIGEARRADASLALVRSQSNAELEWNLGLRHLAESGDQALVAGISLPLGSSRRNRSGIQAAEAERQALQLEQQADLQRARTELTQTWQAHQSSHNRALQLEQAVIPLLAQASEQARTAYERGAYRYSDWMQVQQEWLEARQQRIDAAVSTWLHHTRMVQLTAARP